jgi:hypothetical protein
MDHRLRHPQRHFGGDGRRTGSEQVPLDHGDSSREISFKAKKTWHLISTTTEAQAYDLLDDPPPAGEARSLVVNPLRQSRASAGL